MIRIKELIVRIHRPGFSVVEYPQHCRYRSSWCFEEIQAAVVV